MPPAAAPVEYLLPEDLSAAELVCRLSAESGVSASPTETVQLTLLDTFDWRLYRNGSTAEAVSGAPGQFRWRRRGDGRLLGQVPCPAPRFAWELPAGRLRRELGELLEMRALLPRVRTRCRETALAIRNGQGKVILRLGIEEHTLLGENQPPLRPRLRLDPVRGYPKALERARRQLPLTYGLEPTPCDLLDEALAALGLSASVSSAKVDVALQAELPAGEAACRIFLQLLDNMEANEAGTVADLDSEFLHDFRVAVRRTRSALGQIKGVIPPPALERFQSEFAWLGAITGPTRDLDVYLLNFPAYRQRLPAAQREHLEPLLGYLRTRQRLEHRALARQLRGGRYRKLKRDWRRFLDAGLSEGPAVPSGAARPVLDLARRRIRKVYGKVLRDGGALQPGCPAEQFHELRKTCKKLRYLLEFFRSLFPAADVAALVKSLKKIQDNLGIHNDLEVQATALGDFGRGMQQEGKASAECLMAMGQLVDDLNRRQVAARQEFAPLFQRFSSGRARKLFRKHFGPPQGAGKKGTRG